MYRLSRCGAGLAVWPCGIKDLLTLATESLHEGTLFSWWMIGGCLVTLAGCRLVVTPMGSMRNCPRVHVHGTVPCAVVLVVSSSGPSYTPILACSVGGWWVSRCLDDAAVRHLAAIGMKPWRRRPLLKRDPPSAHQTTPTGL